MSIAASTKKGFPVLQYIAYCIRAISILFVIPFYSTIIFVFGLYRIFVRTAVKCCYTNSYQYQLMGSSDTCFLKFYHPTWQGGYMSVGTCLTVVKGNMTLEKFQKAVAQSYLQVNPGEKNNFKLTQTPVLLLGVWFWKVMDNNPLDFDMRNHITAIDGIPEMDSNTVLTDDQVMEWISKNFYKSFDEGKPYWNMYFIPHFVYKDQDKSSSEHLWAFIFRFHHCYADGMSTVQNIILRMANETSVQNITPAPLPQYNIIQRILKTIWAFSCIVVMLVHKIQYQAQNPLHGPNLSGTKMCLFSDSIQIDTFRNIKRLTKASITSITLAALSETIYQYFLKKNPNSSFKKVLTSVPVPTKIIKGNDKRLGNYVTAFYLPLPTKKTPLLKRLEEIDRVIINHRKKSVLRFMEMCLMYKSMIPQQLENCRSPRTSPFTVCFSNIPGPNIDPIHFLGDNQIQDFIGWLASGKDVGVGVIVSSMGGRFRLSLTVDKAIIPTRQEAQEFVDSWLDNIYKIQSEAIDQSQQIGASQMTVVEII